MAAGAKRKVRGSARKSVPSTTVPHHKMYAPVAELAVVAAAAKRKELPISSYIRTVVMPQARADLAA